MERIETDSFIGSPKTAFIALFTIANVTNKDDVLKWKKAFCESSNIWYNTRQGTKRKGKTVILILYSWVGMSWGGGFVLLLLYCK